MSLENLLMKLSIIYLAKPIMNTYFFKLVVPTDRDIEFAFQLYPSAAHVLYIGIWSRLRPPNISTKLKLLALDFKSQSAISTAEFPLYSTDLVGYPIYLLGVQLIKLSECSLILRGSLPIR